MQYQISFDGKGSQARRPWALLQASYAIVLRNYATGADEASKMPLKVHPGLTSWEKNAGQCDIDLNKHLNFGDLYDELDQTQPQALCFKLNHRSQLPLCANYKAGENHDLGVVLSMKISSEPGCVCPFKADDGTISIIAILRGNDAISLQTAFNPCVFDSAGVQRFLHQLDHVFQFILSANDDFPVMEIDITSKHDQQVLRKYFPPPPKGIDCALHAVFQKHVAVNPAGLAIDAHDGKMTYAELDSASSALAQVLSHAGVGPDIQVPILFEKSRWVVIAMLAVSKAGGCFVPLDASHPVQRLRTIIEQLGAAEVGLASVSCESIMSKLVHNTIVASTCAANNVKSMLPHVDSQLPAYILFTSGSTGQPKGCIITHSSIATSSIMFGRQLGFLSEQPVRTFQFSSYGFDACMIDIFYTLAYGGCICIPSETARMSDVELSMREMAVTHTFLTPSVAAQVNPDAVPSLQNLILGGEKPSESLVRKWSKIVVYNAYGPTETAICSHVAEATGPGWAEGNIGKGFASTSWIVDAKNHHKQLPLGVVGELIIEGPTVARGYLHDISKTRSSFVVGVAWAEPYGDDVQRRFYKTGDLGFVDQQGMVHCIGRKDHQVKLRGVRIELEDVEAHIKKLLPGDSRAAAAVVTSADGHELLVAFVSANSLVSGSGPIATPSPQALVPALKTLNQGLQQTCPPPMVPSAYIPLDVFPLQASGKIDRAKLKGLAKERTLQELLSSTRDSIVGPVAAPLTETENSLSLLWGEALSVDSSQLGANSNFFEEGGNSLAAMRLAQKARRQGLLLTVEAIFRHPTLSEMVRLSKVNQLHAPIESSALSILSREQNRCTEVAIKEIAAQCGLSVGDIECAFPCTTLQESLFALSTKVPGSYIMHFTLKVNADVAIPRLVEAFEEIHSSSSILRTRICQSSSGLVQVVIRSDRALREQIIATNGLPNADAGVRNGIQEMSLGKPLSIVRVVTKEKETYLIWSVAHVLADGYSMSSYLEKIASCYEMRQMSSRIDAKPVSSSFEDFSRSLAHELDGDASKEFWTGYLRDATATPWPVLKTPSFQSQTNDCLELPFESTPRCSSAFTLSTIARAAWALTLSRYTGAQDVIFAATTNGRLSPIANVELVDGSTITTIPVRVNIDFNKTVGQMLQQLTYDVADSIPFEQYGLQRISQIDHSIKDICSTQNTLVVQPEDVLAQDLPWLDKISMDMTFPQALMLECILGKGGFRLRATFDNRVIARDDMQSTLSLFSQIFRCLQTPRAVNMPVRDLPSISEMDEALISTWSAKNAVRVPTCVHDLFQRQPC